MHDYRVTIKGRFTDLTDEQRRELTAKLADHDVLLNGFSAQGGFAYDAALGPFTFRYVITVPDEKGEPEAVELALAAARSRLGEYGHGDLSASSTDMRDIKIRRR
ncbi:DUF6204 family protein [Streptosporangium saharense]|uniref:Uncharacterized protein n=1 Tax=Streptosporangium saharense TaxID=1706840 RepID=A0A7W7QQQ2_9ACTN|nr:DUF6204 family protein [Streptosporangium saharense]MBB4917888.1 hypothetical protein [Streptosporangium saharense]